MSPSAATQSIIGLASGFMAAKQLFVANEVGLFEALAGGTATLDQLALRTGVARRRLRVLADGLCALGLLEREDGHYRNAAAARACLCGPGGADLRPLLRFWNHIAYPMWTGLESAVRSGHAQGSMVLEGERQRFWSEGVEAIQAPPAAALAETFDFAAHQRVLDLGGGTGSWLLALLHRHAGLAATLFELPGAAALARQRLAREDMATRTQVVAGDFFADVLPGGHDVVLLANVLHLFAPERNIELLRRIRAVSAPGTVLLLADFWTDPGRTEPALAALLAAEFMVITGEGDVYNAHDLHVWLAQTGWRAVEHRPLAGAVSLWMAQAVSSA